MFNLAIGTLPHLARCDLYIWFDQFSGRFTFYIDELRMDLGEQRIMNHPKHEKLL